MKYNVHLSAEVQVLVVGIEADTHEEAMQKAARSVDFDRLLEKDYCDGRDPSEGRECPKEGPHIERVAFGDALLGALVDVQGDADYAHTRFIQEAP